MASRSASSEAEHAAELADRFHARFGQTPRVYRAPGRVNLIGEHTDYNDGFVLPAALSLSCWVAAAPRDDRSLFVHSEDLDESIACDLDQAESGPVAGWGGYVRGVAALLRRRGATLPGATLLVKSDVPMGAGLASSAALEVAVAVALLDLSGGDLPPIEVARLCQRAEHEFVGTRCGIMDQFVACHAREGGALLLDCRSLDYRIVPIAARVRLVACNTMVRHRLADGEYNRRRADCEAAVRSLAARLPGVTSLRDVDPASLAAHGGALSDHLLRRARHVVGENARVLDAAAALEGHDLAKVGALMAESHRSLRDDYEVSCPELDVMVAVAREAPGVVGARMTGGGFGGCTVNLVDADAVGEFSRRVASQYEGRTGLQPDIYATEAGAGAARVS